MKKKLRSRRGITLTELLVSVALIGILSAAVVTGIGAGLRMYTQSVALSRTQTCLATLTEAVGSRLRTARSTAVASTFDLTEDGKLTLNGEALVGSGTYSGDSLSVSDFDLYYENKKGVFTLTMTVEDASGVSAQCETAFRWLNHAN